MHVDCRLGGAYILFFIWVSFIQDGGTRPVPLRMGKHHDESRIEELSRLVKSLRR
jgi:hypothetical protein